MTKRLAIVTIHFIPNTGLRSLSRFTTNILVAAALLLGIGLGVATAWADPVVLDFHPDDTIEEIRRKIDANGYRFIVSPNRIFTLPPDKKSRLLSYRPAEMDVRSVQDLPEANVPDQFQSDLPPAFDARTIDARSYVGPIQDQGDCGSCYAFAAASMAEIVYNRAFDLYGNQGIGFSEAYIMWCLGALPEYYHDFFGCTGGNYDYTVLTALTVQGVYPKTLMPYTMAAPDTCPAPVEPPTVFDSWRRLPCQDTEAIKIAILTYGAVNAAVDASSAFQAYAGGIYEDTSINCLASPCYYALTNHAVTLVGWDDNGDPEDDGYWILRNSWGADWGEDGYMRIKYGAARINCAATSLAYEIIPYPPIADAGPDQTVPMYATVTLDATGSRDFDNDIFSYHWDQEDGPIVTLSSADLPTPTFDTPDVAAEGTTLTFRLTVTDREGFEATDVCEVHITWSTLPPDARVGEDQIVNAGTPVTLDGSTSSDPDDGIAGYHWEQTSGLEVTLTDADTIRPGFIAPVVDRETVLLRFQLTVTDPSGRSDQATGRVYVKNPAVGGADNSNDPTADTLLGQTGGDGGGGCFVSTVNRYPAR